MNSIYCFICFTEGELYPIYLTNIMYLHNLFIELCKDFSKYNQFYFSDNQNTDNQKNKTFSMKFILPNRRKGVASNNMSDIFYCIV